MLSRPGKIGGGGAAARSAGAKADYYEATLAEMERDRRAEARAGAAEGTARYLAADPAAPLARWWSPSGTLARNGTPILPGQLRNALNGQGLDGAKLTQDVSARRNRVGGYDMTYSAPKSVSILWQSADPATRHAIMQDLREAAAASLAGLQQIGSFETRTGKAGARIAPAADLLVALYPQNTNRDGYPQLHVHAVVINAVRRADGKTSALHAEKLFQEMRAGGALFRAELAHRLEQRGFAVEAAGRNFEVVGVSPALQAAWSTGKQRIDAAVGNTSALSAKQRWQKRQFAAMNTRSAKDAAPASQVLEERWTADLQRHGLTPEAVWAQAQDAARRQQRPEQSAIEAGLEQAFEQRSVVTERELRIAVLEAAQLRGGGAQAALQEARQVLRRGRLIELGHDAQDQRVFSTPETLARERAMILDARAGLGGGSHVTAEAAEAAIRARPTLSQEQQHAIRHIAAGDRVVVLEGVAGSGKTFALAAVVEAAQASGARVHAMAPMHSAARSLGAETGVKGAVALQGFALGLATGRLQFGDEPPGGGDRGVQYLGQRALLLVDEAGMASSANMATLLQHARQGGAQVVLIGDRRQFGSVEPGDAFTAVADEIGLARLETVRRQQLDWQRAASQRFAAGDSPAGLAAYEARHRVVYTDDGAEAIKRTVEAWAVNRRQHPNASRLVLAQTNAQVHTLNAAIRAHRLAAGELGSDALMVRTLHSGGEKGRGEVRDLELRQGDRLALRTTLSNTGRAVLAGDVATLEAFTREHDPALTLRLDRTGQAVTIKLSELAPTLRRGEPDAERLPRLQHSEAQTVYRSQSQTTDYSIVMAGAGLDARAAYLAATRHRLDVAFVVDSGTIRDRLAAADKPATQDNVRAAFLAQAARHDRPQNAADYLSPAVRQAWMATGQVRQERSQQRQSQPATRVEAIIRHAALLVAAARRAVIQAIQQTRAARQLETERRQRSSAEITRQLGEAAQVECQIAAGTKPKDQEEAAQWEAVRQRGRELQHTPEAKQMQRQGPTMGMSH